MQHIWTSYTHTRKHKDFGECSYYDDNVDFAEDLVYSVIEDARGIFPIIN